MYVNMEDYVFVHSDHIYGMGLGKKGDLIYLFFTGSIMRVLTLFFVCFLTTFFIYAFNKVSDWD